MVWKKKLLVVFALGTVPWQLGWAGISRPDAPPDTEPAHTDKRPGQTTGPSKKNTRTPPRRDLSTGGGKAAIPAPPEEEVNPNPSLPTGPAKIVSEFQDCPVCPTMVRLPTGEFTMGSDKVEAEGPPHKVSINRMIGISKYEITVEQWNACVEAGGCPQVNVNAAALNTEPVRNVSWEDAQKYVEWLTKLTVWPYRLPTEAEWEYAARAGATTRYSWGDEILPGKASCKECGEPWSPDKPLKVGSYPSNFFGLHDVSGNVSEWVSDCWHDSYQGAPTDGSTWQEKDCKFRVLRGGSWMDGGKLLTLSARQKYPPDIRNPQNGFRVVRKWNFESPR